MTTNQSNKTMKYQLPEERQTAGWVQLIEQYHNVNSSTAVSHFGSS